MPGSLRSGSMPPSSIASAARAGRWPPTPLGDSAPQPAPVETDISTRNIKAIAALERAALHDRSRIDRWTDAVTSAAGTLAFLAGHAVWFATWITINLTRQTPLDPYPFNLLMLVTSIEAIVLTSIVLMTQNRMTRHADRRAHLDLQVNLLAEQELTAMLQMLHAVCQRLGVSVVVRDTHVEELLKDTDIHELASAVERELDATTSAAEQKPDQTTSAGKREVAEPTASASAPAPRTPSPHRS
jgi:uncharacterized membrane protein